MSTQLAEKIELFSEAEQQYLEFLPSELVAIESELEYDLESITYEHVGAEMETYFLHNIPESESVNDRILKIFTPLVQKVVEKIASTKPKMREKLRKACEKKDSDTFVEITEMLVPLLASMLPGYLSWMAYKYSLPVIQTLGDLICKKVGASEEALASLECGCGGRPRPSRPRPRPRPRSRPSRPTSDPNVNVSGYENRVIELTNQERRKRGLSPLRHNNKLAAAAQKYSRHMATHNFLSHRGKDGSTVGDRIKAQGYRFSTWAENIAKGHRTPEDVVRGWMNSSGHRRNILNPRLREIGVGYYNRYWTQVFGTPR